MASIADKILQRVLANNAGEWVCTPKDFLDFGSRGAIDQALYRLVKAEQLHRVGHGLYEYPRFSDVLKCTAPVDLDLAIEAVARRDGVRIMPHGLSAANQLNLTNSVPAKAIYVTDGYSRTLKIAGRTVLFQHASPRIMRWAGKPAAPVIQALRWLGRDVASDERIISKLQRTLPVEVKRDLLQNMQSLPGWVMPLVMRIATDQFSTE